MTDNLVLPVATTLRDCLCAALNSLPSPPAQCCLRWGDSVSALMATMADECCEGLAFVRIASVFPTGADFPNPLTDAVVTACGPYAWGATFEFGTFRCAASVSGDLDTLASCADWEALTALMAQDMMAMRLALCCFQDTLDPQTLAIGSANPLPVEGICTGVSQMVTVMLNGCPEC